MRGFIGGVLALALLLSACSVRGPSVKMEPGEVKVDPVTVEVGGRPGFCPPGHAKKGWC